MCCGQGATRVGTILRRSLILLFTLTQRLSSGGVTALRHATEIQHSREYSVDRIHVALAIDTNYVMPVAACIRSILDNSAPEDQLSVTVIVDGVEIRQQERIRQSLNLDRHSVSFIEHADATFSDLPIRDCGREPTSSHSCCRGTYRTFHE
jgi:hypothetical protein